MNQTNRTIKTTERLIREQFPRQFGDRYSIERIVGNSFEHNDRQVNYITVYLTPEAPPLDHRETTEFDILIKEELTRQDIRDWPAIAYVTKGINAP